MDKSYTNGSLRGTPVSGNLHIPSGKRLHKLYGKIPHFWTGKSPWFRLGLILIANYEKCVAKLGEARLVWQKMYYRLSPVNEDSRRCNQTPMANHTIEYVYSEASQNMQGMDKMSKAPKHRTHFCFGVVIPIVGNETILNPSDSSKSAGSHTKQLRQAVLLSFQESYPSRAWATTQGGRKSPCEPSSEAGGQAT